MKKVALLAAVPEEHLISGMKTVVAEGKVAFGSSSWELFRELDELAMGTEVDVYIYASDSSKHGAPKVRWQARYLGHIKSDYGAHPDGMKFRPESTEQYAADNTGHWAVFWEVDRLVNLAKDEAISMNLLKGFKSGKSYVSSFVPHGPTLVEEL